MWTKETMTIPESLLISLLGIVVVFAVLVILDLAVMVISKVVRVLLGAAHLDGANKKSAAGGVAASAEKDSELLAVLASAISDDLGITPDKLKIVSIREV